MNANISKLCGKLDSFGINPVTVLVHLLNIQVQKAIPEDEQQTALEEIIGWLGDEKAHRILVNLTAVASTARKNLLAELQTVIAPPAQEPAPVPQEPTPVEEPVAPPVVEEPAPTPAAEPVQEVQPEPTALPTHYLAPAGTQVVVALKDKTRTGKVQADTVLRRVTIQEKTRREIAQVRRLLHHGVKGMGAHVWVLLHNEEHDIFLVADLNDLQHAETPPAKEEPTVTEQVVQKPEPTKQPEQVKEVAVPTPAPAPKVELPRHTIAKGKSIAVSLDGKTAKRQVTKAETVILLLTEERLQKPENKALVAALRTSLGNIKAGTKLLIGLNEARDQVIMVRA